MLHNPVLLDRAHRVVGLRRVLEFLEGADECGSVLVMRFLELGAVVDEAREVLLRDVLPVVHRTRMAVLLRMKLNIIKDFLYSNVILPTNLIHFVSRLSTILPM